MLSYTEKSVVQRLLIGQIFILACGGRTEIAGDRSDAESPSQAVTTCHPGDANVVLAQIDHASQNDRVLTDSATVYVTSFDIAAHTSRIWKVSASGGAATTLYVGDDSVAGPVLGDDGIYFDVTTSPLETVGEWIRSDGLASRIVHEGTFAPPLVYSLSVVNALSVTLYATALAEGTSTVIAHVPEQPPFAGVLVTQNYFHLLEGCAECAHADRRIALGSGTVLPPIEIAVGFPHAGPNAICSYHECLLDESTSLTELGNFYERGIDAAYVYAQGSDGLHRLGLRDESDAFITPDEVFSVASANGCLYVETKSELLRIAAPP